MSGSSAPEAAVPAASVPGRVEEWARRQPEALAVGGGGLHLTYAELDRLANRLARRLRALDIGRGDVVGVIAERVQLASHLAWAGYKARPYDGVVTLLRSDEYREHMALERWYALETRGVVGRRVPGSHRSMMREPDVAGLAVCIESLVDEVVRGDAGGVGAPAAARRIAERAV